MFAKVMISGTIETVTGLHDPRQQLERKNAGAACKEI